MSEASELVKKYTAYSLELSASAENELDQLPEEERKILSKYIPVLEKVNKIFSEFDFNKEYDSIFNENTAELIRETIIDTIGGSS